MNDNNIDCALTAFIGKSVRMITILTVLTVVIGKSVRMITILTVY